MLRSFGCVWLLVNGCALASAVTPPDAPSNSVIRFEAADETASRWAVRGAPYRAELGADQFQLWKTAGASLKVRLSGARKRAQLRGEQPMRSHSSYLHGSNPRAWRTGVEHFARVRASGVYPGIDALYYQGEHGLETDFLVSPGAEPRRIKLDFNPRRLALDREGNLHDESSGELLLAAPQAYEIDGEGRRHPISSRFRLAGTGQAAFEIGPRDPSRMLVIDPTVAFATYLGGSGRDTVVGIERAPDGRIYVAGGTTSLDLPQAVSLNSLLEKPVILSTDDTFVACYSPDGSTLLYVVYVGGDAEDLVTSLAVDSQGRPTVAGYSNSGNFPTTPGALLTTLTPRSTTAFLYRLSPDGAAIQYSTFLPLLGPTLGVGATTPTLLAGVDASGSATVGATIAPPNVNSVNFPAVAPTKGAFQTQRGGGNDVVLFRLTSDGSAMQWATFYGGSHDEALQGMGVDPAGNVVIVGSTNSNDLPVLRSFQPAPPTLYSSGTFSYNSSTAGFFAKFNSSGSALSSASYFGGQSNNSILSSVALDETGAIYLGGASPVSATPGLTDLPAPSGTFINPFGPGPAVLVKLDPTGTATQYMWAYSFLGGGAVQRVRVDAASRPCISAALGGPITFPGALAGNASATAGFACFAADGKTLAWETAAPSSSSSVSSIVDFTIDPTGSVIGAGNVFPPLPTTANAPQPAPIAPGGSQDGYIFEIRPDNPAPQLSYVNPTLLYAPVGGGSLSTSLTLVGTNFAQGATILWNGSPLPLAVTPPATITPSLMTAAFSLKSPSFPKGDSQIQVSLPAPGGGVSSPFTIKYVNPEPGGLFITPSVIPTGTGATTFTITGSITSDGTLTWNGVPQTLTPAPAGTVAPSGQAAFQFTMPTSTFANAGDNVITSSNPTPGGGSSTIHVAVTANGLPVSVTAITGPVAVGVGQGGLTQTLTVNTAATDATVIWNGSDRPTTRLSNTTLQFVLSLSDLTQMGTAQVQVRSGGVLSPAVTAYIGMPKGGSFIHADSSRGQVYFAGNNAANQIQVLIAGAIPSGKIVRSLDMGNRILSLFLTDDKQYLWIATADGALSRVNVDSFSVDLTGSVVVPPNSTSTFTAIPVAGSSSTIVASAPDGILRIFDGGTQRGFSSADLFPAAPLYLTPVFATPDAVWATGLSSTCMVRLTYDYTGFASFAPSCNNSLAGPWGLSAPEVKVDAGVTYFQSGPETLIWRAPLSGAQVDLARRRMILQASTQVISGVFASVLRVYDLDSAAPIAVVPATGSVPFGTLVPYDDTHMVVGGASMVVLINMP